MAAATAISVAAPASAMITVFNATLNGASESPANSTTAIGLGLVTFDDVAQTVLVNEVYFGLTGPATGGHIHCCTTTAGTGTAAILVPFPTFPASSFGNFDATFTLSSATFAQLLAGAQAGKAYLNIHTAAFPGGEIRGFLVGAVPEPSTYAMMFAGLAAVGGVAVRRRRLAQV